MVGLRAARASFAVARRRDSSAGGATRAPEAPLGGASSAEDASGARVLSTAAHAPGRASFGWFCCAFGVALGLVTLPASAHAPPLGARVLSSDAGGDEVIVTNRGLVFREPTTGVARLLCNEALRINTSELPNVARVGDGGLLVASSSGLRLSHDRGCSWSDVGQMATTSTPALAADPNDPDTVVIASYDSDAPGLRITRDGGASWSPLYATDEADYVHSLLIAAADSARLYATVTSYAPGVPPAHALLRTRDGGDSWQRIELPLTEKDYLARVAAVSPSDPEAIVLYTVANSPGLDAARLLVSRDGGDSFSVALERSEIRGAGYGGDGRLWVAAREGLFGASADLATFEQTSTASELGCVQERGGALFVCGHYAGIGTARSGIGVSADGGNSFERWLDFESVDAAVECPADSLTAALCAQPWRDWELELAGVLPYTPGAYGPVDAPGETPGATPGAVPEDVEPAGDGMPEPIPAGDPAAGDALSATCALGPRAWSAAAGGGGGAFGWAAAGWLACAWLRRASRVRSRARDAQG
jgi:hypothetical protein